MPIPVPQPDVFSITPLLNAWQAGSQMRMVNEDRQQAEEDRLQLAIGQMAAAADTPERWSQFLGAIQRRFPDADLTAFADFSSRDYALGQALTPAQMLDYRQGQTDRAQAAARAAALEGTVNTLLSGSPRGAQNAGRTDGSWMVAGSPNAAGAPAFGTYGGDWQGYLGSLAPGLTVEGMNDEFGTRLASAAADYERETGQRASFTSMVRTNAEQAELYRRYQAGEIGLAAPPGQSRHESGAAADLSGDFLAWMQQNAGRYGLGFLPGRAGEIDPGHIQLAEGGPNPNLNLTPEQRTLITGLMAAGEYGPALQMLTAAMQPPEREPFTLGEGDVRYGPNGQIIASNTPAATGGGDPFTLGQGQVRYDAQGNVIAQNAPGSQIRPMTAAERAEWGIAVNDPRIWAMNPTTGEPSIVGGTPSAGTRLEVAPDGTIVWTQGGPATTAQTAGAQGAQDEMLRTAVFGQIDEALEIIGRNPARTTGIGGAIARLLPGTEAITLQSSIDTIKAQLGFNQLAAMRAAAPSGASGLGQVTERELAFLQSTIATLDLNMNADALASNLREIQASLTRYYAALDAARLQNLPTNADVAARAGAIRQPGGTAATPSLAAPNAPTDPATTTAPPPVAAPVQPPPVPVRNPVDAGLLPLTDLTMEGYAETFQRAIERGMTPDQAMRAIAAQFGVTVEEMFAHLRGTQ